MKRMLTGKESKQQEEAKVVKGVPKLTEEQEMLWSKSLFYAEERGTGEHSQPKQKLLVPLTKIEIKSELRCATALTNFELTYRNPSKESALECSYKFPLEINT